MAIFTDAPYTPGWWIEQAMMRNTAKRQRYLDLALWKDGTPPLPRIVEVARKAFQDDFMGEAVTNFAALLVSSFSERMSIREIRTAASPDEQDEIAWSHWLINNLDTVMPEIIDTCLTFGDSYAMVGIDPTGPLDYEDISLDDVLVTFEDPRTIETFHNPARKSEIRAAVKFFEDVLEGKSYAVCMVSAKTLNQTAGPDEPQTEFARVWVAVRSNNTSEDGEFKAEDWAWDPTNGGIEGIDLNHPLVPVVKFPNKDELGEFEPHIPILRRINRLVFQLTVIVMYQAFKQRAITADEDASEIEIQGAFKQLLNVQDLDEVLTSDPGSWFLLPRGAKVWESTQTDVQGVLSSIKDDVMRLAAVSRRPMAIFAPDNQSAQGATITNEGLIFGAGDRQTRIASGVRDLYNLVFLTAGDNERAQKDKIVVGWNPLQWHSLQEKAQATSQVATVMARRTIFREVWDMTPQEIDQAESESSDESLLSAALNPSLRVTEVVDPNAPPAPGEPSVALDQPPTQTTPPAPQPPAVPKPGPGLQKAV